MTALRDPETPPASILAAAQPRLAHPDWKLVQRGEDGAAYHHRRRPLTLIWSVALEADGQFWQHLSVSHHDRPPTWDELIAAKEWVMGTDTYAYQVAPPRKFYVNLHPNVLHMFRRIGDGSPFHPIDDGRALPEFSHGTGSL